MPAGTLRTLTSPRAGLLQHPPSKAQINPGLSLSLDEKWGSRQQEFRTRFCEGLLSRRVLIAEGATEATSFPVAARRLAELNPATYASVEALGVCVIDAGGESRIADMAGLYKTLGKRIFALCDKQTDAAKAAIEAQVEHLFMHDEKGVENLILKNTTQAALERFADSLDWPPHLLAKYPDPKAQAVAALMDYFSWSKGNWGIAEFLAQCHENEIPAWLREACVTLKNLCDPPPQPPAEPAPDDIADLLG